MTILQCTVKSGCFNGVQFSWRTILAPVTSCVDGVYEIDLSSVDVRNH